MTIVTDPFERWAARLLTQVSAGRPRFGVDEARQLVDAVRTLPQSERSRAWHLLDGFTETARHEVRLLDGGVLMADVVPISRPDDAAAELLSKESHADLIASGGAGLGEVMSHRDDASAARASAPFSAELVPGTPAQPGPFDFTDDPVVDLHGEHPGALRARRDADGNARLVLTAMGWTAADPASPGDASTPRQPQAPAEVPAPVASPGGLNLRLVSSPDPLKRLVIADARGERPVGDEVLGALRAAPGPLSVPDLQRALGLSGPLVQQALRQLLQANLVAYEGGWLLKAVPG
ncbi:MAG: helix-turn-helix domain-containing protein [Archangium sp.]